MRQKRLIVAAILLAAGCGSAAAEREARLAAERSSAAAAAEQTRLTTERLAAEREIAQLRREAEALRQQREAQAQAVAHCAPLDQQQESVNNMWRAIEVDYPHTTNYVRQCDTSTAERTQNCLISACLSAMLGAGSSNERGCIDFTSRLAGVFQRQQQLDTRRANAEFSNCPAGVLSEVPR